MDSILNSIKKMLGIDEQDIHFDSDVILTINSVLMILNQIGVGPSIGFLIKGKEETWVDLLGERIDIEAVKMLVYLKVRLLFDPPSSTSILEAMERQITEFEWRLNIQTEKIEVQGGTDDG